MTRAIVIAYVLLVTACGGASSSSTSSTAALSSGSPESGQTAAEPAPQAEPAPANDAPERLTGMFERLASDLAAVQGDCSQLAGVVTSWVETHRTDYPALAKSASAVQLSDEDKQRYADRLRSAIQGIVTASNGCQGSEQVRNAFTALDQLLNGQ